MKLKGWKLYVYTPIGIQNIHLYAFRVSTITAQLLELCEPVLKPATRLRYVFTSDSQPICLINFCRSWSKLFTAVTSFCTTNFVSSNYKYTFPSLSVCWKYCKIPPITQKSYQFRTKKNNICLLTRHQPEV